MNRCRACATPLVKGPRGAGRKCCPTERCESIYYSGHNRRKCARCRSRLAPGRDAQRLAICMQCVLDVVDLLGLERIGRAA